MDTGTDSSLTQKPPRPPSHLALSIIATILCCLPLGVVGIVYAAKVDANYSDGKYEEAMRNSESAKNWSFASIICGLVLCGLYVICLIVGASGH